MEIKKLVLGLLETNCYIISQNNKSLIIDPADDEEKILASVPYEIVGIIITHYHFDHIGALLKLKEKLSCPIYDFQILKEGTNNINGFSFEMIKTPGHKEDLISVLFDGHLFCGDFIFKGTIGRWDFKGGSFIDMQKSIKKILTYNENIIIHPGHGEDTTLKKEKQNLLRYLKKD